MTRGNKLNVNRLSLDENRNENSEGYTVEFELIGSMLNGEWD